MNQTEQIFQAIMRGDTNTVKVLIEQDQALANAVTPSGIPAVLFAMYYNEPSIIRLLLENGAAVDIFSAAAIGITGRARTLLAANPELVNAVAKDGFSPLGLAAFFGRADVVELLLKNGAAVNLPSANPQRVTPLHSAVAGQHFQIAKLLVENGADVNARQADDFTPLLAAAANGQIEMIRLLLEHGADRAAKAADGRTALAMAEQHGHADAIELLRDLSA